MSVCGLNRALSKGLVWGACRGLAARGTAPLQTAPCGAQGARFSSGVHVVIIKGGLLYATKPWMEVMMIYSSTLIRLQQAKPHRDEHCPRNPKGLVSVRHEASSWWRIHANNYRQVISLKRKPCLMQAGGTLIKRILHD